MKQGKESEMEIPEELVEETAQLIFFALDYIAEAGDDGIERYRLATWWAKHIITRILKAAVDGMPLPGEEGRRDLGASPYAPTEWAWTMIGKGARTFIALCPLMGTGKEEEK